MQKADHRYQAYINILREELIPAMGCTELIAIACAERPRCGQFGRIVGCELTWYKDGLLPKKNPSLFTLI